MSLSADILRRVAGMGLSASQISGVLLILADLQDQVDAAQARHDGWVDRQRQRDRARKAMLPSNWQEITQAVFERDGYACFYCSAPTRDLHCDHVIPLSRGGSSHITNLVAACAPCNLSKGAKTLEEWSR